MKPRRRGVKIGLGLALGGGIFAWFYLNRPMPIEFPEGKPPVVFISAHDIERKPWLDFKLGGQRIVYPRPFELASPAAGIEAVAGYLDFDVANSIHHEVHFEDAEGRFVYSPTAWVKGEPATVSSSTSYSVLPPLSSRPATAYPANARAIYGVPYATEEKFRNAVLLNEGTSWPIKLPVSSEFGPALRKATTGPCGPWTMKLIPRPWKISTAPFQVEVVIEAPADRTFAIAYLPQGTLGLVKGGERLPLTLKYLKEPRLRDLFVTEVTPIRKAVYLRVIQEYNSSTATVYRTRLQVVGVDQSQLYREDSPSVLVKNGFAAITFMGRTIFEDGTRLGNPEQELKKTENEQPVVATLYRKGKVHKVEMPVDIPPLMTKPFMRDR